MLKKPSGWLDTKYHMHMFRWVDHIYLHWNSHGVVAVSNPQGEIAPEDVERVIEAARAISLSTTRQIIEVSPREYSVDGQSGIRNPVGMSGVRLEIDTHIITASTTNP